MYSISAFMLSFSKIRIGCLNLINRFKAISLFLDDYELIIYMPPIYYYKLHIWLLWFISTTLYMVVCVNVWSCFSYKMQYNKLLTVYLMCIINIFVYFQYFFDKRYFSKMCWELNILFENSRLFSILCQNYL